MGCKLFVFLQGAYLYCSVEFEPDGFIDFEVYYLPPGVTDLLRKTVLVLVAQVDHFYSNHFDASKPGSCKLSPPMSCLDYCLSSNNQFSHLKQIISDDGAPLSTVYFKLQQIVKFCALKVPFKINNCRSLHHFFFVEH